MEARNAFGRDSDFKTDTRDNKGGNHIRVIFLNLFKLQKR
jgi:hypothetical protein